MAGVNNMNQGVRCLRVGIVIPAAADAAVTLESLVIAALNARTAGLGDWAKPFIMGGFVNPASADYDVGDTATDLDLTIPTASSEGYGEPCTGFLRGTYVRASVGGLAISDVVVSVWLCQES
jgi:hypothetical protein